MGVLWKKNYTPVRGFYKVTSKASKAVRLEPLCICDRSAKPNSIRPRLLSEASLGAADLNLRPLYTVMYVFCVSVVSIGGANMM